MKPYTTWIEIDVDAFIHNLKQIKRLLQGRSTILAVVKREAYGHGAIELAAEAGKAGVRMLGVSNAEEGVSLRKAGIRVPILVLAGIDPIEIKDLLEYDLSTVVSSRDIARELHKAAWKQGSKAKIHIKIDTGMGRLGINPEEYPAFLEEVMGYKNLYLEGIMTHFACSSISEREYTQWQLSVFREVLKGRDSFGYQKPILHAANSGALLGYPDSYLDMVRPGIILYGCYPSATVERRISLKPVLAFKTRIKHIRKILRGSSIGYDRSYIVPQDGLFAVIPVGYADGYSRVLSNKAQVLVQGKRVPIVGNISMDLTVIDITTVPKVEIGDEVTLIGRQGKGEITAEEIADWAGTIPYEILTSLAKNIPRIFLKDHQVYKYRSW
jgi:alanine racemase